MITIRDIARRLGISHTTVSRALGEHRHIHVDTRALVRATAMKMGYVPNAAARAMRSASSTLVGLVIPDVQNDFYARVARTVGGRLAAAGYQLVLCVTEDDPTRELRDLRALRVARAAGVIVTPSTTPEAATLALLRSMNVVQLLRTQARLRAGAVLIDDSAGTQAATVHLLAAGLRHIAYVGGTPTLSTGRDRLAGFEAALARHGVRAAEVALGAPRPEFARQAVARMMGGAYRPTALVMGSSELTLGALQGLRSAGLRWPHDISIVGYGDPAWFELAEGGITTVGLPVDEVALAAAEQVLAGSAEPRPRAVTRCFAPKLLLRASTRDLKARG